MSQQTNAQLQRAILLHQQGQLTEARKIYSYILTIHPNHYDALHLLGIIALQTNNHQQAVDLIRKAIAINPSFAEAYNNKGNALRELKQLEPAIASFDQATAINPSYAEACFNKGNALLELLQLEPAVASFDHAIAINPSFAAAYFNRGNTLLKLKQLQPAIASFDQAIAINPLYAEACNNRGNALLELKQFKAAIASYDHAIAINPSYAEAYSNKGSALLELKQLKPAIVSFDHAIAINPSYTESYHHRGDALVELKLFKAAIASYDHAINIKSTDNFAYGDSFHIKMRISDWNNFDNLLNQLVIKINQHEKASTPFPLLGLIDSPSLHQKSAQIFIKDKYPTQHILPQISKHKPADKLRIGYFSADFRNHPVSHLTAELFEIHNRSMFDIIAFSFGVNTQDAMRKRLESAFDTFIDVQDQSDRDITQLSRTLGIDIAVDLGGLTAYSRPGIFSMRAAPIQVNYLGYPGTMGADYIDYLIADSTLIPEKSQHYYTEKIVYLPDSYMANDTKRKIGEQVSTRKELGFPQTGFIFCCFNNNFKITPETFDSWMRILKHVEGSVLWLLEDNPDAALNLKQEAVNRGIHAERLIFAKRIPLHSEHLARHKLADLFLDTLPYNAHTTASDALWSGLPVLTHIGESFPGRVAASLLTAIQLPELITNTQQQYETLAIELATNRNKLNNIKRKLEKNRLTTPLFNSSLFARHIEEAYTAMNKRYQADLPPEHMHI